MPYSVDFGKSYILDFLKRNKNKIESCLDIGCGCGVYSFLLKQSNNNCPIYGIEIFKPYIERFELDAIYTKIFNEDARLFDYSKIEDVTIIFAGDVLEHMYRDECNDVIFKLLNKCKILIISLPVTPIYQTEVNGNIYETHLTPDWTHEQFSNLYHQYIIHQIIPKEINETEPVAVYFLSNKDHNLCL